MAEDRTFTLIGNFTDNITPKLRSINEQINALNGTIAKFKENGRSLSKEFGTVAASLDAVNRSARQNREALRGNFSDLERYVSLLNRVSEAQRKASGSINTTIRNAGGPGGPGGPGGGGGGGGSRGGGVGSSVFRDAGNVFGLTVGNTVSNLVSNAIISGFRVGVGLLEKPFQYFANAFSERIHDETTDIQAAGGLFSVSGRKGLGLFPDFNSAMREQQKINYKLSQSAAALPGSTAEYVKQGKLLTDTMITVLSQDKQGSVKFSQGLGGNGTALGALEVMVQKFTEKSVLLQQGTTGKSVYGVPQLIEKLINSEEVSPAMFNRYVSFRDNPILNNAFKEMSGEIGKTGANTADRIKLVYKLLDKALPNEVIQAYKSSVAGTFENLRSLFFDPEVGLFGLGRKFKNVLAPEVNQFGQYINKQGKVTKELSEAAMQQVSIYDLLKDIIVGFGNPIAELVPVLMQLYDPLQGMIGDLMGMRQVAQDFYRNFHSYSAYFAKLGKDLGSVNITQTSGARGALAAINNLLSALNVVSDTEFTKTGNELKDRNANLPQIASKLLGQLMNSEFMETLGKMIGRIIGDVFTMVAKLMSGASNFVTAGGFAGGLKAGFDEAGGPAAISTIIKSFFDLLLKAVTAVVTAAPMESAMLGSAVIFGPGLAAIGSKFIVDLIQFSLGGGLVKNIGGRIAALGAKQAAVTAAANAVPASLVGGLGARGAAAAGAGVAGAAVTPTARLMGLGGGIAPAAAAPAAAAAAPAAAPAAAGLGAFVLPAAVVAGAIIFDKQLTNFGSWLMSTGNKMQESTNFAAQGFSVLVQGIGALIKGLTNTIKGAFDFIISLFTGDIEKIKQSFVRMLDGLVTAMGGLVTTVLGLVTSLGGGIIEAVKNLFKAIISAIHINLPEFPFKNPFQQSQVQKQEQAKKEMAYEGSRNPQKAAEEKAYYDKIYGSTFAGSPGKQYSNLSGAVSSEMKNKPSGSNLVIANSSETVIPAAGGLGMGRLVESIFASARATGDTISQAAQQAGSTIMNGFSNLTNVTQQGDKSIVATQQSSTAKLQNSIAASTQAQLAGQQQLMTAIQQAGANGAGGLGGAGGGGGGIFGGGAGGGGVAKVIAVGKMLQGMGLNVAENPAFGNGRVGGHASNSYHYSGRAIDVTGPDSQLDSAYAKLKGSNPAELLWRTAGHYDHLHVAYAFGLNNPALLNSKEAARNFEAKHMPAGARVQTITANSSERLGGTTTVNAPITINQLPGQSAKELASAVALELSNAIADIRNSSYNV